MNNPRLLLYPIGYILTNEGKLANMLVADVKEFLLLR